MDIPITGTRWIVNDKYGNPIYLTQERWEHITADTNHPEMKDYEEYLKITIKKGQRRQEPLNPRKYRYYHRFDNLAENVNHIVVIVLFGFDIDDNGKTVPNNFIATSFLKFISLR